MVASPARCPYIGRMPSPDSLHEPEHVHCSMERTEAYEVLPGRHAAGMVLLCDHASNALPPEYGTLGLPPDQLRRHIAYDIGAEAVTRYINDDPNRGDDDPTLIMRLSDGAVVPGNRHIDAAEREHRLTRFHQPYHAAANRLIDACMATGRPPAILAIHSFTESWKGSPRPWAASILWHRDPRLAKPLLQALHAEGDLVIGENEPYPGQYEGDSMWRHGTCRGLPHAIIEIRQDLIRDPAGQKRWGDLLSRIIANLLARPELQAAFNSQWPKPDDEIATTPHIP
jgi:predicted N-formylglutamate amidohydrolase